MPRHGIILGSFIKGNHLYQRIFKVQPAFKNTVADFAEELLNADFTRLYLNQGGADKANDRNADTDSSI